MIRFKFSKETLNTSNVDVDPLLYEPFVDGINSVSMTSQNYNSLLRSYIQAWHLLSTTQISRDSLCILQLSSGCVSRARNSRLGCVSEARSRIQTTNFARQLREDLLSRGKITREFVLASNKGLPPYRTLHECTRISQNNASESDVAFEQYCTFKSSFQPFLPLPYINSIID